MRCKAVLPGGAETEPPKALGQLSCVEAGGGQGGVALLQERGKAPSDCCIVLRCEVSREVRRKGSQKVVCARGGAEAQQQPRCLEVVDGGDARQEPVMVVALMPELARDERIMSQRGAERCETLRFWRESPVSDPDALFTLAKVSDVGGLLVGLVAFASRGGSDSSTGVHVSTRLGIARPRHRADDGGVNRLLRAMPQGQPVRDNFDAAVVGDRNIDVHVG